MYSTGIWSNRFREREYKTMSVTKTDSEEKPRTVQLGIRLPEDTYNLIETVIMPFYRSPSTTHSIKLLLEDAADMIISGNWKQKVILQNTED